MTSDAMGRLLAVAGGVLLVMGLLLWLGPRLSFWGRLPGDIALDRGRSSLYAPIASMDGLSLGLTIMVNMALWLWRR